MEEWLEFEYTIMEQDTGPTKFCRKIKEETIALIRNTTHWLEQHIIKTAAKFPYDSTSLSALNEEEKLMDA